MNRLRALWASLSDFLAEVAATRQELHEESQGAQARSRRHGEWETPR